MGNMVDPKSLFTEREIEILQEVHFKRRRRDIIQREIGEKPFFIKKIENRVIKFLLKEILKNRVSENTKTNKK